MKRIVLDTNVLIAAFFWKGHPRTIYNLVRAGQLELLISKDIQAEFIRVLAYKKFGLTASEIAPIANDLRKHAAFIDIRQRMHVVKADPSDNMFLECAVAGNAKYIVSGDHHLLQLKGYGRILILKPQAFLKNEHYL